MNSNKLANSETILLKIPFELLNILKVKLYAIVESWYSIFDMQKG